MIALKDDAFIHNYGWKGRNQCYNPSKHVCFLIKDV
jgi:hypothetical protein